MIKKLALLLVAVLSTCTLAFAQTKQVTGVVSDGLGQPVIGAAVVVAGTTNGTSTDIDGRFTLMAPANATLVVTNLGYEESRISVAGQSHVNVTLNEESQTIDEVVVVGYGSGKAITSTVATVDQVKGDKIQNRPSSNVMDALGGQVAGLSVMSTNGELSATSSFRMHGIASTAASQAPLILLDGAPISSATLNALNANDIQSIDFLKDASATSIFGSRAANGVIYVVSKTGRRNREENTEVVLRTQYSMTSPVRPRMTPMTTDQLLDYYAAVQVVRRDPSAPTRPNYDAQLKNARNQWVRDHISSNGWDETLNNDWWDIFLKKNAPMYQMDLAVTGGSEKTSYYFSGNYMDQTGILPGSTLNRYTFRTNVDTRANKWLHMGLNLGVSYQEASSAETLATQGALVSGSPVFASFLTPPYQPFYDENGEMLKRLSTTGGLNPLLAPHYRPGGTSRLQLNGSGFVELTPFKGFTARSVLSGDALDWYSHSETSPDLPQVAGGVLGSGRASENYSRYYTYTWTNTAEYKFSIKQRHNITALLGHETIYNSTNSRGVGVIGITSPEFLILSMGTEVPGVPSYSSGAYASNSVFGRLEYNFDERYFIEGTLRNDASSRFAKENRNALFYSLGGMWNMKKESFLIGVRPITDLRLKLSYGTQGNAEIASYAWMSYLGAGADYGENGVTWMLANPGYPELRWESQSLLNVGFDMQLWQRLGIEFSYYRRETTDMLMDIPRVPSTGVGSTPGNIGGMRNTGVDLTLNWDIYRNRDWYINFRTTFNYNKNQVTRLWEDDLERVQTGLNAWSVGETYSVWSMQKWLRVDPATGKDVWQGGLTGETMNYNQADLVSCGTRFAPYTGGFSLTASWKGIALTGDFAWVAGNLIFNNYKYFFANPNQILGEINGITEALDYWKVEGDNTKYPALTEQIQTDSRMLEPGDFLRMKNLQLSYTLPSEVIKKSGFIKGLKVWVGGRNLLTLTGYKGLDPEVADIGVDVDAYPNSRQITFGLELKF